MAVFGVHAGFFFVSTSKFSLPFSLFRIIFFFFKCYYQVNAKLIIYYREGKKLNKLVKS